MLKIEIFCMFYSKCVVYFKFHRLVLGECFLTVRRVCCLTVKNKFNIKIYSFKVCFLSIIIIIMLLLTNGDTNGT